LKLVQPGNHLNADDMARQRSDESGLPLIECERWAFEEVRNLQDQFRAQKRSFSYETVLSHQSHLDRAAQARRAGYHTRLVYIFLSSPDANVRRVANRVRQGGHDIPEEKIRQRYVRSLALLRPAVTVFNSVMALTNEGAEPADSLKLIAMQGIIQVRADLDELISRLAPDAPSWSTLGFVQGLSMGTWAEHSRDAGNLSESRLELAGRRKEMLRAF
jgi:predicted ABC-type ATPase